MIRSHVGTALIQYELLRSGRNWRNHLARWILLFMLAIPLSLVWLQIGGGGWGYLVDIPALFAWGARTTLLLLLVSCIYIAIQSFCEERDLHAFPVLLSTPMTSWGICFAKWAAVVIRASTLLLMMMPFVSLLFVEGGLATEQVFATVFMMTFMVAFFTAVGVFSSVLYRGMPAAAVQSFSLLVVMLTAHRILLEFPCLNSARHGTSVTFLGLTGSGWNHVIPWRAFRLMAEGDPLVMGASALDAEWAWILLAQGALLGGGTLLLLFLASFVLSFTERRGASSFWAALWGGDGHVEAVPRAVREGKTCRPWLSSPLVWRSVSTEASYVRRGRRGTVQALVLLGLTFLPYLVVGGWGLLQYGVTAVGTLFTEGVLPGVPTGFPWVFGASISYLPDTVQFAYTSGDAVQSAEAVLEFGRKWMTFVTCVLLLILLVAVPVQMALTVPRERAGGRLSLLLTTTMKDRALHDGYWYEVVARWRGVLAALGVTFAVMMAMASFDSSVHRLSVLSLFQTFLISILFWARIGMYVGLKAASVRGALRGMAKAVGLIWVLPLILLPFAAFSPIPGSGLGIGLFIVLTNPLAPLWLAWTHRLYMHSGMFDFFLTLDFLEGLHVVWVVLWLLLPLVLYAVSLTLRTHCRDVFRRFLLLSETGVRQRGFLMRNHYPPRTMRGLVHRPGVPGKASRGDLDGTGAEGEGEE